MGELKQQLEFQGFKPFFPVSEMNINMELTEQQQQQQQQHLISTFQTHFNTSDLFLEKFLAHQQPHLPAISCPLNNSFIADPCAVPTSRSINAMDDDFLSDSKKRKPVQQSIFSPAVSASTNIKLNNRLGRERRGRSNKKDAEKAEEVIHVRAKRGQATDSHSLAERVRREKINEKMRCLQDLVPGCHKAMGMTGMLDEIINYVQSLQNQIEFLSTELAAACASFDLNIIGTESPKKLPHNNRIWGTNAHVDEEMEKWARIRYGELYCLHSTWPL